MPKPSNIGSSENIDFAQLPKNRQDWLQNRLAMEAHHVKSHPRAKTIHRHWDLFNQLLKIGGVFLKLTGIHRIGLRNAKNIKLKQFELSFVTLPKAFDGYTILHITDPHFDMLSDIYQNIIKALPTEPVDLVVLTGDYRTAVDGPYSQIIPYIQHLKRHIATKDGFIAILGNHDSALMVNEFEQLDIQVLINETIAITRADDKIYITGLDDVHYYYTVDAKLALQQSPEQGFKIALVHSAEAYSWAAENDYSLYLCGHSHGGQICLPNGRPMVTHIDVKNKYAKGFWYEKQMIGYSSNGAGVVGIPVRFFCEGEITLFILKHLENIKP